MKDYYEKVLKVLEEQRNRKANVCGGWKDSGDRGACFEHEVKPLDLLIEETKRSKGSLIVSRVGGITTVGEAAVGLFELECGEIICISEYRVSDRREATIVSSGENYCGDGDMAKGYSLSLGANDE